MSAAEVAGSWASDSDDAVDLGEVADSEPPNHPLLVKVTDWLTRIVLGEEAARMLASLDEHGGVAAVAPRMGVRVGQVWMWREPRISVGRKGRAKGGASYALPVRVVWAPGHLQLAPVGRSCGRSAWTASGMGWELSGEADTVGHGRELPDPGFAWPASVVVTADIDGDLREVLTGLVESGRAARWEFLLWLQPTVSSALNRAHTSVRMEMGNPSAGLLGAPLVDGVKLDQLRDQMLFGDDSHTAAAERLLTLCTAPGTFRKVDPLRYLTTAIRRDAMSTLRRAIGDPHIGPKVRGLARELGTHDVDAVVAEYRRRWPGDHLATDRAEQALSVGSDAMAHWVQVVER